MAAMGDRIALAVLAAALAPAGAAGQAEAPPEEKPAAEGAEEPTRPRLSFGLEAKAHFRDSDENRFLVRFPPEAMFPPDFQGFLETVNAGSHLELSVLTLFADAEWGEALAAHAKVDLVDLYDRNPTSEDHRIDVDEAWVRLGRGREPAVAPERPGLYLKLGKMPHFERQNDRHLESYGLVSTAFNRFEDMGVEIGADLGRHLYVVASATQGNPVFLRDPNALAGDNGTPSSMDLANPPSLKSGVVILYDAEVEDLDVDGDLEAGAGLGLRWSDGEGRNGFDLLAWGYERKLAQTVALNGTIYGGDLDLLRGPFDATPFPGLEGDEKREVGGNLWLYLGGFTFFGQFVDQELAGLARTGYEAEVAWRFELPVAWGLAGRQLFPWVQPAVRYSKLDPDFRAHPNFPAPSTSWEWEKLDYGVRLAIVPGIDLTVEMADHSFILASGAERDNDEFLTTLRWRM
jgi:hypothetical protein